MEAVTAFVWGPLCPVITYGILRRRPWRYTLALVVSLGQLYGDVLYFLTCHLEGAPRAALRLARPPAGRQCRRAPAAQNRAHRAP